MDFNSARRQGETQSAFDVDDIRNRLSANPRAFIDWLYSGRAYYTKTHARIGNTLGEPGSSLSISLATGQWTDHATDEHGDLISLYRAWRGYSGDSQFILSLKEIAHDFLRDPIEIERQPWQPTPIAQIEKRKTELGSKPRQENVELGAPVATYKYYDLHGKIIASVIRYEPEGTRESKTFRPYCYKNIDGKQKWVMGAPDLRPLYGLPDLATSPTVVLCEGEGCADALVSIGIVATSAMQGAKAPIDKTDWSPLAGKTIIVWPDNDAPGLEYAKTVSERLQSMGCKVLVITPPANAPAKWDAADCVSEGQNAHEIIASANLAAKPRIRLVTISELANLPPPEWLIEGIITVNGLSELWGRSGSLKSFVALDKALCIATGKDWHGKKVRKGSVVYLAAEGSHGLGLRAIGWMKTRGRDLPEPDFRIIPHSLTLANVSDMDALIEALKTFPVTFIVVDTLSRTFGSGNPNQPSDMNAFVNACDRLREATGAHVMVIHHGGKDGDKNELGNEALRNASDTVIHIRRKTTSVELINEAPKGKQKDAEEFKTITLNTVKVAYQHNNQELYTLILNQDEKPIEQEETTQKGDLPQQPQQLGGVERQIMKALADAGEALGLVRLQAMTQANKGTLHTALKRLEEKLLVQKGRSEDNKRDVWTQI